MGLFDKKFCDVCGNKIGFLGNRKLEDGNLCKECAGKLSYWFGERKHSTVEQIKQQLAYREENLEKVKAFHTTKTIGGATVICFDEDAHRFMVRRTKDAVAENPDVLDYGDVTGVDINVSESRTEDMFTAQDGKQVSYVPAHFTYRYTFTAIIRVSNPYFEEMSFNLNNSPVEIETVGDLKVNPRRSPEYMQYEMMGMDIKKTLSKAKESAEEAAKPKQPVVCPYCEATTVPDEIGRCEYCGKVIG